ncbi:hypothetical protein [Jiella avicenniae]|uniref:Uncharacterized protein n=1 Tax=Jiella avicenniae TaxID=2907202 RepID=A0A9X1P0E3_9HYPH|nr:hypothetical protein [Jiella avicenniae]MCE7027048.1 hypothetical protein [Jiella avicenniae]
MSIRTRLRRFRVLVPCLGVALVLAIARGAVAAPANVDPVWWKAEIAKAQEEADRLWDVMRAKGTFALGTAVNEVDVDIHTCHILSIMLGKNHLTPLLVAPLDPPQPDDEPGFAEGVEGNSRSNWANLAKTFLGESQVERVRAWNLDCVGKFGITGRDFIREENGRALVAVDGDAIRVLGNVEPGFFEELKAAVEANPAVTRVVLGSAGGGVGDAVEAGRYIRARGLDTELYNDCRSACSLVFLGGVERRIWSPYPQLGFHRISSDGVAIPDYSEIYDLVRAYADDLGADGSAVVAFMKTAGVREMHHPEMDELCAANVATAVQRVCFGTPPRPADGPTADGADGGGVAAAATAQTPPAGAANTADQTSGGQAADRRSEGEPAEGICADIAAQRRRVLDRDVRIAGTLPAAGDGGGGLVAIYDQMLVDYGC